MDNKINKPLALIAGYGNGLGAELAHQLTRAGYYVIGLSRSLHTLSPNPDIKFIQTDLSNQTLFSETWNTIKTHYGIPTAIIHNATELIIGPFFEQTPERFEAAWQTIVLSTVIVAQATFPAMIAAGGGSFIVSGATASIRGSAGFAPFACAKFALRGLSQSLAREYGPQGIHVAHVILDGVIWSARSARRKPGLTPEVCLDPKTITQTYLHLIHQPQSAWTHELDLRPSVERF